ncbi:MAG: hypothetical protein Q7S40_19160 [Opitutaceae bacterium]|nr:hypothetical protein [Opitutaceae bacterium]
MPRLSPAMTDRVPAAGETTLAPRFSVAALAATAALLTACLWIVSRVFLGLDFTDEMQYYAEIAALTRTHRFFQVDLFIQQLGYVLLLPLFDAHAALFPDQSYLIVFGRLVLLGGYIAVALAFWRATAQRAGFSLPARLAATALVLAWIPFQIFSPSYNTLSYLLLIAALALWHRGHRAESRRCAAGIGALFAALTVSYPTAGLGLWLLFTIDTARRNRGHAVRLTGFTVGFGLLLGAVILALHGRDFIADLRTALQFSNALALREIREPDQLASLFALGFTSWLFIRRVSHGVAWRTPFSAGRPTHLVFIALAGLAMTVVVLVWLAEQWLEGLRYFPAAVVAVFLMLLAGSISPAADPPADARLRSLQRGVLFGGCAVLLFTILRWGTGYFATAVWLTLLCALASEVKPADRRAVVEIVFAGTVLGATFAVTSGNGLHNFGVGAMAAAPFLALYVGQLPPASSSTRPSRIAALTVSILVLLQLVSGAWHPYREEWRSWTFRPVTGVPAFRGIWTSPVKLEAVQWFRQLVPPGAIAGQRLLVTGPQPWLYFIADTQPATPMAYMHFSAGLRVDQFLAANLFRHGEPDAILVPNAVPLPLHAPLGQWMAKGFSIDKVALPTAFASDYQRMIRYDVANEIVLLRRRPPR